MVQVAHQDGILRLVQQRGLVADADVGQLPLDLGRGTRGKDLQGGGDEVRVGNRVAEQHEDDAHHLAVSIAQLLSHIGLGAHKAQHGGMRVKLLYLVGHDAGALRQQLQAGGAGQAVFLVG